MAMRIIGVAIGRGFEGDRSASRRQHGHTWLLSQMADRPRHGLTGTWTSLWTATAGSA